ncbi:hypothetical protein BC830DRAFT_1121380 [Chytriomyces sp. MP71]|nr:hypothetical protein BC830DRAFT_1121380 [Chytriomyces sp. MP71]
MEEFTRWCLACERRLIHDAVYCSAACLRKDHLAVARVSALTPELLGAATDMNHKTLADKVQEWMQSLPTKTLSSPESSFASLPRAEKATEFALPIKTDSFHHHQQRHWHQTHPTRQTNQNSSQAGTGLEVDLDALAKSLLSPTFSLEFRSRRRTL